MPEFFNSFRDSPKVPSGWKARRQPGATLKVPLKNSALRRSKSWRAMCSLTLANPSSRRSLDFVEPPSPGEHRLLRSPAESLAEHPNA
jgi:hypothetical protein